MGGGGGGLPCVAAYEPQRLELEGTGGGGVRSVNKRATTSVTFFLLPEQFGRIGGAL